MNANWLSVPSPEECVPFDATASSGTHCPDRGFEVGARLGAERGLGRTGVIHTAHGVIRTPAFIPVGTKANVKALTPEMVRSLGAQAVLANAYHLYLQPGSDIVDDAGGFASFMNWAGPTYTDSGGFQVLSLGAGFKKVLSQEFSGKADPNDPAVQMQAIKASNAVVDDDGVVFSSHIDGTKHRFNPEVSMGIQHQLGADIMFAFDELTSLLHPRGYQVESLERTHAWAERCLAEHKRLTQERSHKPYQQLWGVIQGAQWEDLRRQAARTMADMEVDGQRFDGFGVGGALEKENLGTIVSWVCEELGEDRPRHLLGISEPRISSRVLQPVPTPLTASTPREWHETQRSTRPMGASTSRTRVSSVISHPSSRAASATPARTTRAPTSTTCSRRRRSCPLRWRPSTTSGLRCDWWTLSAPPSRTAASKRSVPICSAVIRPGGVPELKEYR